MAQPPNMEIFETYFQRADLDRDGKISGNEAVVFFQASNLPKHVLARVWSAVDNGSGFLGRSEFYNALRLVTVAQSGRELTQDIVKSALFGPAVAKIPAPQINLASLPAANVSSQVPLVPQGGAMAQQYSSQSIGLRGPTPPLAMSTGQQMIRPSVAPVTPVAPSPVPGSSQLVSSVASGTPGFQLPSSNVSNISLGSKPSGTISGPTMQVPSRIPPPQSTLFDGFGLSASSTSSSAVPKSQTSSGMSVGNTTKSTETVHDSKAATTSVNNISSVSSFGGDIFSAALPQIDPAIKSTSMPTTGTSGLQSATVTQADPFPGAVTATASGSHPRQTMSQEKAIQESTGQATSGLATSSVPVGPTSSASVQPWPRLNSVDIKKYEKVFVEVDIDKDGKITGEEARKLFLSWKLPREVLKQVWDLSDQDADSMLSFREFCIALYLMERSREGSPLPNVLPDSVKMDPMLPLAGHPSPAYGASNWGRNPGPSLARPPLPPTLVRPSAPVPMPPVPDGGAQPVQQKSKVPALEKSLVDQLSAEEQAALNSKLQEAVEADKKVGGLEKEILESRQKIDYYRTKMQELIVYKSRCDNRINEISQRASADKLEMESLAKKYEEKYKKTGDVASKLSIEEATFRDIQERKMGLYTAIVKMEQGGNVDGVLQQRADQIQSDLEELVKTLNARCKKYGLVSKAALLVELPSGWQPTIQEGAANWDEDWDKFVDEGFTTAKDVNADVINTATGGKSKSDITWTDTASVDGKSDQPSSHFEQVLEARSSYARSDDGSPRSPRRRSPPESLLSERVLDSPTREHVNKDINSDASPRNTEIFSDRGAAQGIFSSDKFSEDQWRFDDTDSAWGFGSKEPDFDQSSERSFFSSGNPGLNPIRTTESPRNDSRFQKQSSIFADSVPGTPFFNYNSPSFNHPSEDHSFDTFSRFDSFNMNDSGLFPTGGTLARFDSVRSTRDSARFTSFDDSDPFGSMGPFKSDNQTSKHTDSFGSSDHFKSGQGESSWQGESSRRESDGWSAF